MAERDIDGQKLIQSKENHQKNVPKITKHRQRCQQSSYNFTRKQRIYILKLKPYQLRR